MLLAFNSVHPLSAFVCLFLSDDDGVGGGLTLYSTLPHHRYLSALFALICFFLHSLATRRAHSQMYAGGDDSDFACTNCSTAYHWHELPYSTVAHRRIYPVLSISPFVSLLMAGNSFVVVELAVSCSSIKKSKVRLLMIYLFIVNCFVCLCATHLELVWLAPDRSAQQH